LKVRGRAEEERRQISLFKKKLSHEERKREIYTGLHKTDQETPKNHHAGVNRSIRSISSPFSVYLKVEIRSPYSDRSKILKRRSKLEKRGNAEGHEGKEAVSLASKDEGEREREREKREDETNPFLP